jgi:hypothetical protein
LICFILKHFALICTIAYSLGYMTIKKTPILVGLGVFERLFV